MKPIGQEELVEAMTKAAIPSIKKFIEDHSEETFFGFALETLAEEGYFLLGAGSVESFQPVSDGYVESGTPQAEVEDEIRWNNQEWPYFDFNGPCPLWRGKWEDMELRIRQYQQHCYQLDEPEDGERWGEFMTTFRLAATSAFQRILDGEVLSGLKKTSDFRAWVFEHHDVF